MKWDIVRDGILQVVQQAAGIATSWRDDKQAFVDPGDGAECILTIDSFVGLGWDEFRTVTDPVTNYLQVSQNGLRQFTITVLVEAYEDTALHNAMFYLTMIKSTMERQQVLNPLRESTGITIYSTSATRSHGGKVDDHVLSAASFDLMCSCMENIGQEDVGQGNGLDPITTIDHVQVNGTITDVNGTTTYLAAWSK